MNDNPEHGLSHGHDHSETVQGETGKNLFRLIRIAAGAALMLMGILFHEPLHATAYHWAEYLVLLTAYVLVGAPVIAAAVKNILRGRVFDEMLLMTIATLGAIAIHELTEAVAVMLFYSVGEHFQDRAVDRSRRSIRSLLDLRPDTARVMRGEAFVEVSPEEVEPGALIEVRPGERIPLDGEVVEGESSVETSALTGESVPRTVSVGDDVLSSFINESGRIKVRVTRRFEESSVSRILELVENASSRKAPTERFISRFAAYYTPIMVGLAAVVAFLPPLIIPGALFSQWIYRALVLLVISCPCALVISIPLGYFGGIGRASRNSILIKGANYVDALKDVDTLVMDKTGTLTKGVFRVTKVVPRNGCSPEDLLRWAALAEAHSTHPIARSIRTAYPGELAPASVSNVREEKGYGVSAMAEGRAILAGNDKLLHRERIEHQDCGVVGTVVYVVLDSVYMGYLLISDEIKPEAAETIRSLRNLGVERLVMLTGDNRVIAESVAKTLGIDEYRAELLPEEKAAAVEELKREMKKGRRLAFVGDGINDAPVLMVSDIGIAMGALGSDAAIEAADLVLMDDRIDRVPMAIRIARFTRKVVIQNIVLALLVKAVFLAFGAFGLATIWEAVIADVGVALLAVLNSMRTLGISRRI
ncbi:MAG: cadmium-translocating P-type ATPase [Spirochaetales bacterium]|nr:cadmium-translocating P-type ATPase [Spirochaetales bacterium]